MNVYIAQLETAARAVELHSPTTYTWLGIRSPRLPKATARLLTPGATRNYLLYNLRSQLYRDFYCQGEAVLPLQRAAKMPVRGLTPFVERLTQANLARGYWESGWKVAAVEEDTLVASREGLSLRIDRNIWSGEIEGISPGSDLNLPHANALPAISPGYYMAVGENELSNDDGGHLVRLYWHINSEGAVLLMSLVSQLLNEAAVPYRFKVVNEPDGYTRRDAAVLYIRKAHYHQVRPLLQEMHTQLAEKCRYGVPALTKQLAPGLGLAEDPGRGESFGYHRCTLLAEGLVRAYEAGKSEVSERLAYVAERFGEEELHIETPYLRSGSSDDYPFEQSARPATGPVRTRKFEDLLSVSHGIGRRLVREAIWHGGMCNWVGATPQQENVPAGGGIAFRALGPDLYNGTSGIALYLAELWGETGDSDVRDTALGAVRQALHHAEAIAPHDRLGLYAGWPGIALAAFRVGLKLNEDEPFSCSLELLGRLHETLALQGFRAHRHDLMAGRAGLIIAFQVLREMLGGHSSSDQSLLESAIQLGDQLLEAAERSKAGYSWKTHAKLTGPNLTGFAHGTAGIAHALLALYQATGAMRYRHAAEMAFQYEQQWFDPVVGNWPDLRTATRSARAGKKGALRYVAYWCHGAAGMALARLHAYSVLRDVRYKEEALSALKATSNVIKDALRSGVSDFSLCHGLAGEGEALQWGFDVLGKEGMQGLQLALEVANIGAEKFHSNVSQEEWPCGCGAGAGQSQGLMLGLAGIGLYYLRLHNASVPSAILLTKPI
ncbi:MAG TPA: lanthionine synthetase LanC family protein [Chloroflexia bacterium]|nr:lanthionine synthetase LanC family protein [Chloroflexia bacterium]